VWLCATIDNRSDSVLLTDSLCAQLACWALGDDHPVAQHALRLTERNMSEPRRHVLLERQRTTEAALAEELLRSAQPSARDAAAAVTEARQELTPVLERVWALRNVAATLAQSSAKGREQARKLLEQALDLQQGRYGGDAHPARLGELWRRDAHADPLAQAPVFLSVHDCIISCVPVPWTTADGTIWHSVSIDPAPCVQASSAVHC
jgi:hypothetical protein